MNDKNYVLIDEKSTFIDERVKIGENVIIYENNRIDGCSEICDNVTIYPNSFIVNSIIGKGSKIYSSYIENCRIGARNIINPFSIGNHAFRLKNKKSYSIITWFYSDFQEFMILRFLLCT